MTTTNSNPKYAPALTAEDVAALRECESVSFHHRLGNAYIRAMLDTVLDQRTYSKRQQKLFPETRDTGSGDRARIIGVASSIYAYSETGSGTGWTDRTEPAASCFGSITSARHSDIWPTIASLIRPDDQLHLRWIANNESDRLREAGLHYDQLRLTIHRGQRKLTFALADQISPANSLVRMIRRNG